MVVTRQVTWGEALVVEQFRYPGGLKAAVEVINAELGATAPARSSYQRLFKVSDPADLTPKERWRAWLLLATFGKDPNQWGIGDDVVPKALDPERLGAALEGRWALYIPSQEDLDAMRERDFEAGPDGDRDFSAEDLPGPRWSARESALDGCDEADFGCEPTVPKAGRAWLRSADRVNASWERLGRTA